MLSIGKLALGQQRYYDQQVAQGRDDYYSGRGEAPGEWAGAGAHALGLSGGVSAEQFNALLAGQDPRAPGERLRGGVRDPEVAALDLTFSAPKSVSGVFAVAPAEVSAALVDAHEEAVRGALGYLESEAAFVRRGHGGAQFEHAGGLIAAAYRHRMSRALDPQLHTHVVMANLARGADGRYTALHHPSLYRAARTAGYLYQSHLRAAVRDRLGLEWGPVVKGAAELQGLPPEVLREFSQRRAQVEAAVAEREAELGRTLTRAERSTWGAIATRERKQYGIDTHTWRDEVTARGAEHGLDRATVETVVGQGQTRRAQGRLAAEGELAREGRAVSETELAEQLTGPSGLTERTNTFDEASVLREYAAAAAQGARVDTLRGHAVRFAAREDVLGTERGALTSAELVERERALISAAVDRAGEGTAVLDEGWLRETLADAQLELTREQSDAVVTAATSGHGVDVIEALAGTGKTYTAGALGEAYRAAGYEVIGAAPSARGARELSERAGIAARTLDSRLLSIENGWTLTGRHVVILDEAGMASTRATAQLLEHAAEQGAKVIAIGDPGQLPSVQAGGWLRAVGARLGVMRLTEVMRQRDPAERRALAALHNGIPERYLGWATTNGRAELMGNGHGAVARAVGEWLEGVEEHGLAESVLIARDNETRRALNDLAREHRGAIGALGEDLRYGPVSVAVGDRVILRRNERDVDVDNGMRGTVRHVHASGITIETDAHLIRELPAEYVAEHVEHAYALTGHGMQGGTVERVVVLASVHDLSRGWSYTALSRARGETRLLITDTQAVSEERAEVAPVPRETRIEAQQTFVRVARRMRERDDEDLAIDQLQAEADLAPPATATSGGPLQERAASDSEPGVTDPHTGDVAALRARVTTLRAQVQALPIGQLERIEALDVRALALTERRDQAREQLERAPAPPRRRLGRGEDPHLVARTRLASALGLAEQELERVLSERTAAVRELGQPDAIRQARNDLTTRIGDAERQHLQLRDQLADREVAAQPRWATQTLGERPAQRSPAAQWDRAARTIARYRLDYGVTDETDALGREPANQQQRGAYRVAQRAVEQAREIAEHDLGLG